MLLIVLFLSGVLRYLPQPVLAAIVLMAVMGLFNVTALKHFWRADRTEFVVAIAALSRRARLWSAYAAFLSARSFRWCNFAPRFAAACGFSRTHPRNAAILRLRASSGQRTRLRRAPRSGRIQVCFTSTWTMCATSVRSPASCRSHAAENCSPRSFRVAAYGHCKALWRSA